MSAGFRNKKKSTKKELEQRADMADTLLRTMAALLIQGGYEPITVTRESILMAGGFRVNAQVDARRNVTLTLQDAQGNDIHADQSAHGSAGHDENHSSADASAGPMVLVE